MISRLKIFIFIFLFLISLFFMILVFSDSGLIVRSEMVRNKENEEKILEKNEHEKDNLSKMGESTFFDKSSGVELVYTFSQDIKVKDESYLSKEGGKFVPPSYPMCVVYSLILPFTFLIVTVIIDCIKRRKNNGKNN